MRILPGVLKELLKHVPTVLFQVVDWNELVSELPKLSRRMLQKEGYEDLLGLQRDALAAEDIVLTHEPLDQMNYTPDKKSAIRCLTLYFEQLYSPDGLFLDLRSHHFIAKDEELWWHPSGLWTQFSEEFRQGLLNVYEGFYLEKEELYQRGLISIGLLNPDWSQEDRQKLADLFKAQFGEARTSEMKFELDHLRDAIMKMTDFLMEKKVKITKDFLYLGIYLVTLYSHLELSGHKLPVKDIYLKVKNKH